MFQIHHIGAMGPCSTWIPLYIRDWHIVTRILHIRTMPEYRGSFTYVNTIKKTLYTKLNSSHTLKKESKSS